MARNKDYKLMELIELRHSEGVTDSAIAREAGRGVSTVNYYRVEVLGLSANFRHRTYRDNKQRLLGYMLRNARCSAARRGIECDIDYLDIDLPERCPLLNVPLVYREVGKPNAFNSPYYATLDRIDNTKGYVEGNVWILSRKANNMKSCASLEELKTFAANILQFDENHRARGDITDS